MSPARLCVGVLSGTSADAAEAVVCEIEGSGPTARLQLRAHVSRPFGKKLSQRVLAVASVREVCALNFELGEVFAEAVLACVQAARLQPSDIAVIGSHGQTVAHLPPKLSRTPSTLQIGEAAVIAERTGVPVVSDFRVRDMAAGGEGAPLVPYADWVLFRKPGVWRALQNIGGIANLSIVGERLEDTLAFDTGPGNMLLDALARRVTKGRLGYDRDGALSKRGEPIPALLSQWLKHPFLSRPPPKSTGRESFGDALAAPAWRKYQRRPYDVMATALAFTVESVARAYERYILPRYPLEGVYVSGGGSRHPTLMQKLSERLRPLPVQPLDVLGFPEGAKEAACFALLASEHLARQPANLPQVTGARRRVVLGKMTP